MIPITDVVYDQQSKCLNELPLCVLEIQIMPKKLKNILVKWELIRVEQSWCLSSRKTTSPGPGIYMDELPVSGHTVGIVMTEAVAEAMMIGGGGKAGG